MYRKPRMKSVDLVEPRSDLLTVSENREDLSRVGEAQSAE